MRCLDELSFLRTMVFQSFLTSVLLLKPGFSPGFSDFWFSPVLCEDTLVDTARGGSWDGHFRARSISCGMEPLKRRQRRLCLICKAMSWQSVTGRDTDLMYLSLWLEITRAMVLYAANHFTWHPVVSPRSIMGFRLGTVKATRLSLGRKVGYGAAFGSHASRPVTHFVAGVI